MQQEYTGPSEQPIKYLDPEDMLTEDELLAFDRGDWPEKWGEPIDWDTDMVYGLHRIGVM
jgi:hypothetical protein